MGWKDDPVVTAPAPAPWMQDTEVPSDYVRGLQPSEQARLKAAKDAPIRGSGKGLKAYQGRELDSGEVAPHGYTPGPQSGIQSQVTKPMPPEISPGVIRASPPLLPGFKQLESVLPGWGETAQDFAIPFATTALAPELAPLRAARYVKPLLESAGNIVGQLGNRILHGTPTKPEDVALDAALPMAGRLVYNPIAKGTKEIVKRVPGAPPILNKMAADDAAAMPGRYAPPVSAKDMFTQLQSSNATVDMAGPSRVFQAHLQHELGLSDEIQNKQVINYLRGIQTKIAANNGRLGVADLHDEMVGLGDLRAAAERAGGPGLGKLKDSFAALSAALSTGAVTNADVGLLKTARATAKRELALKDLTRWITDATVTPQGQGEMVKFNAAAVLKNIKHNRLFGQSLAKGEADEINQTLIRLNKIPTLDPPANVNAGSMRQVGKLATFGAGGSAVGGPYGAAAGLAIAWLGPKVTAWAVGTWPGRKVLASVLRSNKGVLDRRGVAILTAGAQGAFTDHLTPEPPPAPAFSFSSTRPTVKRNERGRLSAVGDE